MNVYVSWDDQGIVGIFSSKEQAERAGYLVDEYILDEHAIVEDDSPFPKPRSCYCPKAKDGTIYCHCEDL